MGWTYWALNGEDSYDLLDNNYDATPVSSLKQSLLAGIQFPLPGAGNGTPPPTGAAVVRVLGGELLVRRLPGPGGHQQRRQRRDHPLEGKLDAPRRPPA